MSHQYTVPLKKIIKDLNLQILYYPETDEEILRIMTDAPAVERTPTST